MRARFIYAIGGAIISAVGDIAINLLTTGIQQRAFPTQFSNLALGILAGITLLGAIVGSFLGGPVQVPASTASQSTPAQTTKTQAPVTVTRLRALFSYSKLKGKGIHLSDILLIGSKLDIDS